MHEAQLIITAVGGKVSVTGPIQNKALCYGLLECAKDAIRDFQVQAAQGGTAKLVIPDVVLPPHFGNGGKRA